MVLTAFGIATKDRRFEQLLNGEAWLGGTVWHGLGAARVSFSNWSTAEGDVDRLVEALGAALLAARSSLPVR